MRTLIPLLAILLFACNDHRTERDHAIRQRDSLERLLTQRDSSINNFLASYTDIQENLDSITLKGNIISKDLSNQVEFKKRSKEQIINDIRAINQLMDRNREKIEELNKKLKSSAFSNMKLQKMIASLNEQIQLKDQQMLVLNDQLNALNSDIIKLQTSLETINLVNDEQSQVINRQTEELHTAYYVVGRAKELQDKKVIDKTGGLLGLGKTSRLHSTVNDTNFIKIDYTQVTSIPLDSRSVELVTSHPSSSYSFEKDTKTDLITQLHITDPEKFWSESKYLVVIVK